MKDKINAVLVSDINGLIISENPYYIISEYKDGYVIYDMPLIIKNYIGDVVDHLAYDYDFMSEKNKIKYSEYVKTFYKSDEKYLLDTKVYTIKKESSLIELLFY